MTDINELLARDPANCTRDDIVEIVRIFRERRKQFELGNMMAGSTKKLSPKAKESVAAAGKLDLKKFGL